MPKEKQMIVADVIAALLECNPKDPVFMETSVGYVPLKDCGPCMVGDVEGVHLRYNE